LTKGHYVLADTDRNCHYTVSSTDLVFADNKDHDRIQTLDETTWGDGTRSDEHTASADAHYGHAAAFDFFYDFFDRNGVYDKDYDEYPWKRIYSRVHVGKKYSNAFWHEEEMSYGDGDDTTTRPFVSLDVAAHLFTHGLIENTANLEYTGESGALSEATSDIMSVLIDYYAVDRGFRDPNYLIGESINFQPGTFERSLVQPSSDKVNYEANGGMDALVCT
jgi:Zn-dependent metalloprotease